MRRLLYPHAVFLRDILMLLSGSSPFWRWQAAYRPAAYVLALSGGRDSMALLQALVAVRQRLIVPLTACYVDHGWSTASGAWGAFCVREAAARGVACEVLRLDWQAAAGESMEARARALRYQALAARLPPRGVLLTAHHREDQVETFFLQLLRGSGLDGLAAMPAQRPFADGAHWRPLLDTPRADIEAFVAAERVAFLDDPSNADTRFARNRLRHTGLPPLAEMAAAVARSAGWLAEAQAVQQALLDGILGAAQTVLPWDALVAAHGAMVAKALLRRWLQRAGQPAPPGKRLLSFVEALGGQNGHAELCYGGTVVVQHRGCLHLFRASTPQSPPPFAAVSDWPGVGVLRLRAGQDLLAGRDCRWALFPCAARWQAPGQRYPQSLKNFLQNSGVPPYLRRRLPLLLVDGEAAWLGGFGAAAGRDGLAFDWHQQAHSVSISHHFSSVSDA